MQSVRPGLQGYGTALTRGCCSPASCKGCETAAVWVWGGVCVWCAQMGLVRPAGTECGEEHCEAGAHPATRAAASALLLGFLQESSQMGVCGGRTGT